MKHSSTLEIRDVRVRFGGLTALDDVSLDVASGQVVGVIGPNGAGKTTLLNVLCGFIRPDAGQVLIDGRAYHNLRPHRLAGLGIARTMQGVGLFERLTVIENVMIGASCRATAGFWSALLGLPRSDRDERRLREEAGQALDRVGAAAVADAWPGQLVRPRAAPAAAEQHLARVGSDEAAQHVQQRGLARPVRPYDAKDVLGRDGERDGVECGQPAETDGHASHFQY